MAFIKFFTVFDDEYRNILINTKQKTFDINGYPSVFFIDDVPYYETINGCAEMYCNASDKGKKVSEPTIPASVFEAELKRAYDEGYYGVAIICPHSQWTDYKHQAEIAAKRFNRKVDIDELGFRIKIYDSKQLGAGVLYLTNFFAESYRTFMQSVSDFFNFMDYFKSDPVMFILEEGACKLDSSKGIKALSVRKNKVHNYDISKHSDSLIFDKFAELVVNEAEERSRNLVISLGSECSFAGNVIGRIEKGLGKSSLCTIQYGVSTASVVGNKAICISLV